MSADSPRAPAEEHVLIESLVALLLAVTFFTGPLKLLGVGWLTYLLPDAVALAIFLLLFAGRAVRGQPLFARSGVMATETGGPAEILQDGITGLLVPPGDASRLAGAMLTLLTDAAGLTRMGAAWRARAREHFTAERMAREVERVYEAVSATTAAREAR